MVLKIFPLGFGFVAIGRVFWLEQERGACGFDDVAGERRAINL